MLETPPLAIPDGALIEALNFEAIAQGGYRRVDGYERFDGQPLASLAAYWVLEFTDGDLTQPLEGGWAFGVSSGAKGQLLVDAVLSSGAWDGTAVGYLVLTNVTGSFTDTEDIGFIDAGDGFDIGFSNGFG